MSLTGQHNPEFTAGSRALSPRCFSREWEYKYTKKRKFKFLQNFFLSSIPMPNTCCAAAWGLKHSHLSILGTDAFQ